MFSKDEIIEELRNILKEKLKENFEEDEQDNYEEDSLDNYEIGLDDNLTLLGLNSITFIKIVVSCEKKFDIEFEDEELDYEVFGSIRKIADCIEEKINKKG